MNYSVSFILDNKEQDENFIADNPGAAFALALKKYPGATLLGARAIAQIGHRIIGTVDYAPPRVQRPLEKRRTFGAHKPRKDEAHGDLF